jgi:hypothetical protein
MFVVFLLIALTFALLAYAADREKHYAFAAMLAGGAWLFAGICVLLWVYNRAVGYSYDAVKIFMPAAAKKPVYAPYVEHVPPDWSRPAYALVRLIF